MNAEAKNAPRSGFTTGSAAAAAAAAATAILLGADKPRALRVALPPFASPFPWAERGAGPACGPASGPALDIAIEQGGRLGDLAWASVIKDAGDDPDATHGARIVVFASRAPFSPESGPDAARAPLFSDRIFLYGGKGVGLVTLPGLPVAVGEPAINPEPRKQIALAAARCAEAFAYTGPLHLLIRVPQGLRRAAHTLNERLGIRGGISILGTSGIVKPYSHDAWKATIGQGLSVASALGLKRILLATGRRSERLGFSLYPDLPAQAGIQAADFAAFALREAGRRAFERIIWVCFPGKLLKLAQGLEWTHAKNAPADLKLLAGLCRKAGASEELVRKASAMPTASGVFDLLREAARTAKSPEDRAARDALLGILCDLAMSAMLRWLREAPGAFALNPGGRVLALHVFSLDGELLAGRESCMALPGAPDGDA